MVRDDVVHLAGDPGALSRDGQRRLLISFAFQPLRAVVQLGEVGAAGGRVQAKAEGLASLVGAVTCTEYDAPGARSTAGHVSVPAAIAHPAGPDAIDQATPLGSGSFSTTALAVPPGVTPLLTVIVNPIGSPAETLAASAVLMICRFGHSTVVVAEAVTGLVLLPSAVAVFGYALQLASVVGAVTCTE